MKIICLLVAVFSAVVSFPGTASEPWKRAEAGWQYEWPRDHLAHHDFKTEWWYFTGNLRSQDGRRFGYQLTFFRQGVRPPGSGPVQSRFVTDSIKFGHFAVTDVSEGKFLFTQSIKRGAFGEAGFSAGSRLAWLGDWNLELAEDGAFIVKGAHDGLELNLRLENAKPLVIHGEHGISVKSAEEGHASHYYSATRLRTRGSLSTSEGRFDVTGESWFDHEWATNQLAANQTGWDWFSIQFGDGTELMIYRLRLKDGTSDRASSGSWIAADGTVRHLKHDEIAMLPEEFWTSTKTGARYPIGWKIRIATLGLEITVRTPVEKQELALQPVSYWEGLIDVSGTREGRAVKGHGYLELTGYAGPIVGISGP